jgi:hypothetical protein
MDVNGGINATQGPYDGVFKSTYIEGALNATIDARLDWFDGLVLSIKGCRRFKTLHMAWLSIDFKCVNISSFYNTTSSKPSSFDVPIFNSFNFSCNLSSKVSSYNSKFE